MITKRRSRKRRPRLPPYLHCRRTRVLGDRQKDAHTGAQVLPAGQTADKSMETPDGCTEARPRLGVLHVAQLVEALLGELREEGGLPDDLREATNALGGGEAQHRVRTREGTLQGKGDNQ